MPDIEPHNREEHFLNNIAAKMGGGDTVELEPHTRIEHFMQNIADAASGGGGGSSLPSYTAADKGKFLGLAEDAEHTETVVIVPEQTATFDDYGRYTLAPLSSVVGFDNLTDSDTLSMTVNGNTYLASFSDGTASAEAGAYKIYYRETASSYVFDDNNYSSAPDTVTVTLTKSVPAVEPKWTQVSGLPSYTGSDIGKVLTVGGTSQSPAAGWANPSANTYNGTFTGVTFEDDGNGNLIPAAGSPSFSSLLASYDAGALITFGLIDSNNFGMPVVKFEVDGVVGLQGKSLYFTTRNGNPAVDHFTAEWYSEGYECEVYTLVGSPSPYA